MRIASGKVVDGRVELDTELPEGASVTVLAPEGDETFEADAETEQMLLESIAQCDKAVGSLIYSRLFTIDHRQAALQNLVSARSEPGDRRRHRNVGFDTDQMEG